MLILVDSKVFTALFYPLLIDKKHLFNRPYDPKLDNHPPFRYDYAVLYAELFLYKSVKLHGF